MSETVITIYGSIQAGGENWSVSADITVKGDTMAEARGSLSIEINKLYTFGLRPASAPALVAVTASETPNQIPGPNAPEQGPVCPVHITHAMRRSKYDTKKGEPQYYCSQSDGGEYCKWRGKLNDKGEFETWKGK